MLSVNDFNTARMPTKLDLYFCVCVSLPLGATSLTSPMTAHMVRSQSVGGYSNLSVALPPQPPPPQPRQSPACLPSPLQPQVLRSYSVPNPSQVSPPPAVNPPAVPPRHHPSSVPSSPMGGVGGGSFDEPHDECTVCCEKPVNCVLYTCGHMCMCFDCATAVKQNKGGLCPICRQTIRDVIKIYRSWSGIWARCQQWVGFCLFTTSKPRPTFFLFKKIFLQTVFLCGDFTLKQRYSKLSFVSSKQRCWAVSCTVSLSWFPCVKEDLNMLTSVSSLRSREEKLRQDWEKLHEGWITRSFINVIHC